MFLDYKALFVVMAIGLFTFAVGRGVFADFIGVEDYARRRKVWVALTVLGFASPSIWVFAAVGMPIMFWAARKDSNPLALYVLIMFAVPNAYVAIPAIGIGQVFDLSYSRILAFAVLLPVVWRERGRVAPVPEIKVLDVLLISFAVYQLSLQVPYEAPTNTLRSAFLKTIDTLLIYYSFSRMRASKQALGEIAASLVLMGVILAQIAIFESLRKWLLFPSISANWGVPDVAPYLMRGSSLRSQATTGHSLVLGYTLAFCISFWLYIQAQRRRSLRDVAVTLVLVGGLLVTYSRGAWIMAALVFVVFMALRPGATKVFVRTLPMLAIVGVVVYLSPLKESVIDRLPIVGTSDQETVQYRQLVAEVSWRLIKQNPLIGDPYVANNLEELRQGQGIIDLINGYIVVTLYSGLIGLGLFVSFFLVVVWKSFVALRAWKARDPQAVTLGACLLACMLASLFFIATAGYGAIEYLLAGIMASYVAMSVEPAAQGHGAVSRFLRTGSPSRIV